MLVSPGILLEAAAAIAHYGVNVRQRDGVSLARQTAQLLSACLHGISPGEFYMYQLYRGERRGQDHRHFGFSRLLKMQQLLIDTYDPPDYPLIAQKHLFAERCIGLGLPTVPVLAEFRGGAVVRRVVAFPQADLFSKPSDLMIGMGTRLWRWQEERGYIDPDTDEALAAEGLCERLSRESKGASRFGGDVTVILQEKMSNHASMVGTLTSGGLSTVRIVTCRTPAGSFEILPPALRMPVGNAIADNIAQGGLAAPIDLASGQLCGPAIRKDKTFGIAVFDRHPTTGQTIRGFQLPYWPQVTDLALIAHRAFPSLHFVGWDVALLEQGPVLLEGNAWWDVDLTIMPHGITLSDTPFPAYFNHFLEQGRAVTAS